MTEHITHPQNVFTVCDHETGKQEKQAKNDVQRAHKKDADDALDEYTRASKNIDKNKPKELK